MFKQCTVCRHIWDNRQEFINDPDIDIIGYQANFKKLEAGLFYFNHICRNTIAIKAEAFVDLYKGPLFKERKTMSEECPEYCIHKEKLAPCLAECECAYVREIIQILKKDNR